jgi:hypothetical protein
LSQSLPVEPLAECGFTINAVSVVRFLPSVVLLILALQGKFRYNFIVVTLLRNAACIANNNDNDKKEGLFQSDCESKLIIIVYVTIVAIFNWPPRY